MVISQRCGASNAPTAVVCTTCGSGLDAPAAGGEPVGARIGTGTITQGSSWPPPAQPDEAAPPAQNAPGAAFKGTMVGIAPSFPTAASGGATPSPTAVAGGGSLKRTVLGMAAATSPGQGQPAPLGQPGPAGPPAPMAELQSAPAEGQLGIQQPPTPAAAGPNFKRTVLGMASPVAPMVTDAQPAQVPAAPPAQTPAPTNTTLKRTVLGMAAPDIPMSTGAQLPQTPVAAPAQAPGPSPAQPPAAAGSASLKQTTLGMAGLTVAASAQAEDSHADNAEGIPATQGSAGLKRTVLGLAPNAGPAAGAPGASASAPGGADASLGSHAVMDRQLTVLGWSPAAAAPPATPPAASPPSLQQAEAGARVGTGTLNLSADQAGNAPAPTPVEAGPAQPGPLRLDSKHRTQLGVAIPGIAPIQPGIAKTPSQPPAGSAAAAPMGEPMYPGGPGPMAGAMQMGAGVAPMGAPGPTYAPGQPGAPDFAGTLERTGVGASSPTRTVLLAGLALVVVVLLAIAVLVVALGGGSRKLKALVKLDSAGKEYLELACPKCTDGTKAAMGGKTATFSGGKADLPLGTALEIGENKLTVSLSPPNGSSQDMPLVVPVEYRVRVDLEGLAATSPVMRVVVEAVPGTSLTIDGKPIQLGADGSGRADIDVSAALTGASPKVEPLERTVPYRITPPGSDTQTGEATLRVGITPLEVYAPGETIVVDNDTFMLAGQTLKGASVAVSGRPVAVDASGRFAQPMTISAVGKTTIAVRATAKDHAPRLFPIQVRRVTSLRAEADAFAARATRAYSAIVTGTDSKKGWTVALAGKVVETRLHNQTSVALVDVSRGCEAHPCLARVVYGAKLEASAGDIVTVYGRVTGAVEGTRAGTRIPEIRAEFVLPGTGP